jgi:hypothetical protein
MKQITLILILISIFICSNAQNYSREYGKISAGDFEVNSFLGDKSIEAIVLYDVGSSQFIRGSSGYDIKFKRRTKIRILSSAGIDHSEIEIPLYQEGSVYEKLHKLQGATYYLENGNVKTFNLDEDEVYEEKVNESWVVKKFAMPAVKEGAVIEFSYEIITPYIFNLQDWEFQRDIPTLYSEYVVRSIPFFSYVYIKQGVTRLNQETSFKDKGLERAFGSVKFNDVVNTFVLLNVPAFEDESFITSREDFIIKMDFQLSQIQHPNGSTKDIITTWPQLCNELLRDGSFEKFYSKSIKKAGSLNGVSNINSGSDDEKLKQAIEYVKTNYRWNNRNGYYPQKEFKEFLEEKVGNSANINLFLTGLLQSMGFEAHPVLISTRSHGKINKGYPFSHYFNYVLTQVKTENGAVLVDATDEQCNYNQIPFRCLNETGLVVKKDSEEWVSLNNDMVSGIEKQISLQFSEDLEQLTGEFSIASTNYDATNFRKVYTEKSTRIEDKLKEKELKLIDSVKTENLADLAKPYKINFKAECPFEKIGDKLFLSPFLNEPMSENPFKQNDRTYPIDMNYIKRRKYKSNINIPEGYSIQELPENYSMDNKWMKIDYQLNLDKEKNTIEISAEYVTTKAVYQAEDYRNLKFMHNEMIKKFNEKIIFTKSKNNLEADLN